MNARDELADLIASVTIDTTSGDILRVHPDGETPVFEGDQRTADALLAAGYRKPQHVTTIEELDALPIGSVILDPAGLSLHKNEFTGWRASNGAKNIPAGLLELEALPATVLYEPEATA